MTDRTPDGATSPSAELRAALAKLVEAIDATSASEDTGELRRLAVDQLAGLDRPSGAGGEAGGEEHEGPIEALRDALHRFETDHPVLTTAINDVSHYLSGLGI